MESYGERRAECERLLKQHVGQLLEHFDSVRIFVTHQIPTDNGPQTVGANDGGGNWYASLGLVKEWVEQQDHRARVYIESSDARDSDASDES